MSRRRPAGIEHVFVAAPPAPREGADARAHLDRWVEALVRESEIRAEDGWRTAGTPRTVHVGGPLTPALAPGLPGALRTRLLGGGAPREELSVEAPARDLSAPLLETWVADGVSRVSVGEPSTDAERIAALLRASGLIGWAVDLPFGRAEEDPQSALERARVLAALEAPQISLAEAAVNPASEDRVADEYLELGEFLEGAGYRAWELTSFARPGLEPAHFPAVWRGAPYVGLGPGAHSFDGARRIWNLEDPDAYLSRVERGEDPAAGRERPGPEERTLERVWSGLRLAEGIRFSELPSEARVVQARWVGESWAHPDPHRLRLTHRGWLLLDGLAVELASAGPVDAGSSHRRSSEA